MNRELADLLIIVLSFVVLGLAAARFGVDSRGDGTERTHWE